MKLTVDPNQTKFVAPLLIVLIVAVGAIAARIRPSSPAAPAAIVTKNAPKEKSKEGSTNTAVQPQALASTLKERNPFDNPILHRAPKDTPDIASTTQTTSLPSRLIPPVTVETVKGTTPTPDSFTNPDTPSSKAQQTVAVLPEYHLQAIVRGPKGYVAILQVGQGEPQTVVQGSILEGGYRAALIGHGTVLLKGPSKPIVLTISGEKPENAHE